MDMLIWPVALKVVKLVSITTQKKINKKIHQNFRDEGPMCIFYGTRLKKSFVTAESLEEMIRRLMVGGGRM